jgi:hypothetical protein
MEPDTETEDYVLTKSKKVTKIETAQEKPAKQRKPKTPEQIEQFRQMASKRMQNIAKQNREKKILEAKRLLQEEEENQKPIKEPPSPPPQPPAQAPARPRTKLIQEISDSETDEEIIVVKKQKKPKKKTIIIEDSSESEEEKPTRKKQETPSTKVEHDRFRSQQNKKSLITIHNNESMNSSSRFFI